MTNLAKTSAASTPAAATATSWRAWNIWALRCASSVSRAACSAGASWAAIRESNWTSESVNARWSRVQTPSAPIGLSSAIRGTASPLTMPLRADSWIECSQF